MAIDIDRETIITLGEACRKVPGQKVSPYTMARWATRGVRGCVLETLVVGTRRVTSVEALRRHLAAMTAAANARLTAAPPAARQRVHIVTSDEVTQDALDEGQALRAMLNRRRRGA